MAEKMNTGGVTAGELVSLLESKFKNAKREAKETVTYTFKTEGMEEMIAQFDDLSEAIRNYRNIISSNKSLNAKSKMFTTEKNAIISLKQEWNKFVTDLKNKNIDFNSLGIDAQKDLLKQTESAKQVLRKANILEAITGDSNAIASVGSEISTIVNLMRSMPNFSELTYNSSVKEYEKVFSVLKKIDALGQSYGINNILGEIGLNLATSLEDITDVLSLNIDTSYTRQSNQEAREAAEETSDTVKYIVKTVEEMKKSLEKTSRTKNSFSDWDVLYDLDIDDELSDIEKWSQALERIIKRRDDALEDATWHNNQLADGSQSQYDLKYLANYSEDYLKYVDMYEYASQRLQKAAHEYVPSEASGGIDKDSFKAIIILLQEVNQSLLKIHESFGIIDDENGLDTLLSSLKNIGSYIDNVVKKFDNLSDAISNMNMNIVFNEKTTDPIARARKEGSITRQGIKDSKRALQELAKETGYKDIDDVMKIFRGLENNYMDDYFTTLSKALSADSYTVEYEAYRDLINLVKEASALKNIDISSWSAKFEQPLEETATNIKQIVEGTDTAMNQFANIFKNAMPQIDISGMSNQLDDVVKKLQELSEIMKVAFILPDHGENPISSLENEINTVGRIKESIENIIEAINRKNEAFKTEERIVDSVVESEGNSLDALYQALDVIADKIKEINALSIDVNVDKVHDAADKLSNTTQDAKEKSSSKKKDDEKPKEVDSEKRDNEIWKEISKLSHSKNLTDKITVIYNDDNQIVRASYDETSVKDPYLSTRYNIHYDNEEEAAYTTRTDVYNEQAKRKAEQKKLDIIQKEKLETQRRIAKEEKKTKDALVKESYDAEAKYMDKIHKLQEQNANYEYKNTKSRAEDTALNNALIEGYKDLILREQEYRKENQLTNKEYEKKLYYHQEDLDTQARLNKVAREQGMSAKIDDAWDLALAEDRARTLKKQTADDKKTSDERKALIKESYDIEKDYINKIQKLKEKNESYKFKNSKTQERDIAYNNALIESYESYIQNERMNRQRLGLVDNDSETSLKKHQDKLNKDLDAKKEANKAAWQTQADLLQITAEQENVAFNNSKKEEQRLKERNKLLERQKELAQEIADKNWYLTQTYGFDLDSKPDSKTMDADIKFAEDRWNEYHKNEEKLNREYGGLTEKERKDLDTIHHQYDKQSNALFKEYSDKNKSALSKSYNDEIVLLKQINNLKEKNLTADEKSIAANNVKIQQYEDDIDSLHNERKKIHWRDDDLANTFEAQKSKLEKDYDLIERAHNAAIAKSNELAKAKFTQELNGLNQTLNDTYNVNNNATANTRLQAMQLEHRTKDADSYQVTDSNYTETLNSVKKEVNDIINQLKLEQKQYDQNIADEIKEQNRLYNEQISTLQEIMKLRKNITNMEDSQEKDVLSVKLQEKYKEYFDRRNLIQNQYGLDVSLEKKLNDYDVIDVQNYLYKFKEIDNAIANTRSTLTSLQSVFGDSTVFSKMSTDIDKLIAKLQNGDITLKQFETQSEKIIDKSKNIDTVLKSAELALNDVFSNSAAQNFAPVVESTINKFDELNQQFKSGAKTQSQYESGIKNLCNSLRDIEDYAEDSTEALRKMQDKAELWSNGKASIRTQQVDGGWKLIADYDGQRWTQIYSEQTKGIQSIVGETKKATNALGTFFDGLKGKWGDVLKYALSFGSIYEVFDIVRQGASIIKELDDALTEMQKVSDESLSSLQSFQKASFDLASNIGTTGSQIQQSTADFMRLGETLDEAKESAQAANILFNVSEFESIDEATTSLIAMSAAYSDLDKMEINDKLNNIGNNFSISTDGVASALQKSASALTTAGNDIDEAIALITAGNAIIQDPDSVGAGLRTIALRITGTEAAKEELESIGEDVSDFVVQTSAKSQKSIKDFTKVASNNFEGFDILDDNGNFKSTYEIMLGISEIYEEIVETDKKYGSNMANGLLETLAGKNRANIAGSILQNPKILKQVYESSQKSEGSALEENQKHLESISGHVDKLKNKWQELWSNTAGRDTVNWILDIGTGLLDIVDKLGLIQTALGAITVLYTAKNVFTGEGFLADLLD